MPGGSCALRILDFLPLTEDAGNALAANQGDLIPYKCAYVEFFSLGEKGEFFKNIGISLKCSDIISVYTQPPDPGNCKLDVALGTSLSNYSHSGFATNPDIYLTLADGDQDRPNYQKN